MVDEAIPDKIPVGFTLRVKCSSLRDGVHKKIVHCCYQWAHLQFSMPENETLQRLKTRVADWMNQRGQGPEWTVDGPDRESIDFSKDYEIIPSSHEVPIRVFLKQMEVSLLPSQSWISISDLWVKNLGLPLGTLFRIYPVSGTVDNQDADDFSYDITWEAENGI
jgi:hypothetical protein